jgi:hypothetical protein
MERLTRKSSNTDMVWFVDHDNNMELEPCEMSYTHNKLAIQKLAEYEDLEEQGRLIILTVQDIHPCRNCGVGWGSISSDGCHGCEETCVRLKEYNDKYNK